MIDNGQRYDRIPVLRGQNYVMAYTYTGREFTIRLGTTSGDKVSASWYSPRNGEVIPIGPMKNTGEAHFDPPGEVADGNDWVLLLDNAKQEKPRENILHTNELFVLAGRICLAGWRRRLRARRTRRARLLV